MGYIKHQNIKLYNNLFLLESRDSSPIDHQVLEHSDRTFLKYVLSFNFFLSFFYFFYPMSFAKIQIEIYLVVKPRYLNEPAVGIFKDLSQYLLRYSRILSGIPLSFEIEGVKPTGKILEDGSIYANCLVSFCVFAVGPGSILHAIDGYVCGVFPVTIDENESFTGDFMVKSMEDSKLIGSISNVMIEDSDF